jgi:energy-converting hydrogenase Eha subunit A
VRHAVAVSAVALFMAVGLLILWAPAEQPIRFVLTVALVFALAVLAAAIALATALRRP